MFQYTIRRLLLMIPTFVGATFMVFFILQVAPDGPFERAVKQLKEAQGANNESGSSSSDVMGDSSELTPELLNKLRMQYGLDKPIIVRYLIWLGVWQKEVQNKTVDKNYIFRETVDKIKITEFKSYLLQRYIKLTKDENENPIVLESGVGLEFSIPEQLLNNVNLNANIKQDLQHFHQHYKELPSNPDLIGNWKKSSWKIAERNEEQKSFKIVKRAFNGILTGYLGYSQKKGKNVSTLISERLHISAVFGITSFILVYLVCIPLGIMKSIYHGTKFDILSSATVFVGYSIPGFALGVFLLVYLGGTYFPLHGWRSPNFEELSLLGKITDQIHHAFLPIICYMVGSFATLTILMKNSLMENLGQDYVRTAFAKGLDENRVIYYHAVRNSLIPMATGIGGIIGVFLGGSYLIEKVFGIDGIGLLSFHALVDRDYDIMMGFLVIAVTLRLVGNLISDLCYAAIDPRIRFK